MQHVNANGPAVFYAGANSTDNGNNTNISFIACGSTFVGSRNMNVTSENQNQTVSQHALADKLRGLQIYPNPISENATLVYDLPDDGNVIIEIYDVMGKCIYHQEKLSQSAGNYSETIFTKDREPGIYNCRIITGNQIQSIRLIKTE